LSVTILNRLSPSKVRVETDKGSVKMQKES